MPSTAGTSAALSVPMRVAKGTLMTVYVGSALFFIAHGSVVAAVTVSTKAFELGQTLWNAWWASENNEGTLT